MKMNNKHKMISIIVIVKNDYGIKHTLNALKLISMPTDIEIIVVDSSGARLNEIKQEFIQVNWLEYKSKPKKPISIPEQRNMGVKAAKGTIIVFIDANCIPEKDWLLNLSQLIIDGKERIVSGKTISQNNNSTHDLFYEAHENTIYLDECATINLAIDKEVFARIGLFDEDFEYGSDSDFTWRAIDAGYNIRYKKDAIISHDWGDGRQELRRSFLYGKARGRLYKKHKNKFIKLVTKEYYILFYITYIIFLPLTLVFPLYPLIILIPMIKNRRTHPFKMAIGHLVYATGFMYEYIFSKVLLHIN